MVGSSIAVSKGKVPYNVALELAQDLERLLQPGCERMAIAGSLRRKVGAVGDIELVVIPRMGRVVSLFEEFEGPEQDFLTEHVTQLVRAGVLQLGRPGEGASGRFGPRYKCLVYRGVQVDLFEVLAPASWGVQLLLRTGPAGFSRRLVMQRRAGGLCPAGLRFYGGHLERFYPWPEPIIDGMTIPDGLVVDLRDPGYCMGDWEPIDTPEEEDVLRELGLRWIQPEARR